MNKRRFRGENSPTIVAMTAGVVFSAFVLAVVSFIASLLLIRMKNPTGAIRMASLASLLISGGISSFVISRTRDKNPMGMSTAVSVIFSLIILTVSLISNKGSLHGANIMNLLAYAASSFIFSLLGRKREKRRRHR